MKARYIIIPLIIIAAVAGIILVRNLSQDTLEDYPIGTVGNTAGNLNNGGYFCEYDGKVYFSNSFDNGAMYVMNSDESECDKIINQSVKQINVAGSHMFYYQSDNTSGSDLGSLLKSSGLYRATTAGKHLSCLKRGVIGTVLLSGSSLYYQYYDKASGYSLYKMDLKTEEDTLLAADLTNPACGVDRYIYFNGTTNDHDLYRLDTTTDEITRAFTGNIWNPVYSEGYIYYQNLDENYNIYRLNINSGEVSIVAKYRTEAFNVFGSYVFFTVSAKDGDPCLMRIAGDGTGATRLLSGNFCNLCVTSRYLYFNVYETGELYHCSLTSDSPSLFSGASAATEEAYKKYKNGAVQN